MYKYDSMFFILHYSSSTPSSPEAYASCQLYLQSARNRQGELEREKEALEEKVTQVEREVRQLTVQNSQLLSEATLLRLALKKGDNGPPIHLNHQIYLL